MLRQKLKQQQLQKLSPQQIQLMKLLQVPTINLDQRIKEELEANPVLEEGEHSDDLPSLEKEDDPQEESQEDFELDEYISDYIEDDPMSYSSYQSQQHDEDVKRPQVEMFRSFHDYLEEQWGMKQIKDPRKNLIALQLIGSVDADGYIRRDPMDLCDDLLFAHNLDVTEAEVQEVLGFIQTFDPPGVGARDLQETLLIQIRLKIQQDIHGNGTLTRKRRAEKILEEHFDAFSKKHYEKLSRAMDLEDDVLKGVIDEILKLNPKPASAFQNARATRSQYILPDFIVENRDGELELRLNSKNAPDLRINAYYADMLRSFNNRRENNGVSKKDKEAVMFIKQKIDSARWFIDAIHQRQQTLYKTMYAILQYQKEYFLTGDERNLKPMILKDIAELTALDISTVSRVANSKYVQTEFGTRRLKDFFSESVQNSDGEEVSTLEVKKILQDVVEEENKVKPLSDEKLKSALEHRGYNIARRTIAKYREQLGIPVARLRREFA